MTSRNWLASWAPILLTVHAFSMGLPLRGLPLERILIQPEPNIVQPSPMTLSERQLSATTTSTSSASLSHDFSTAELGNVADNTAAPSLKFRPNERTIHNIGILTSIPPTAQAHRTARPTAHDSLKKNSMTSHIPLLLSDTQTRFVLSDSTRPTTWTRQLVTNASVANGHSSTTTNPLFSFRASQSPTSSFLPTSLSSSSNATPRITTPSRGVVTTLIIFSVLALSIVCFALWSKYSRQDATLNSLDQDDDDNVFRDKRKKGDRSGSAISFTSNAPLRGLSSKSHSKRDRDHIANHHLSISRPFAPGTRPLSRATGLKWATNHRRKPTFPPPYPNRMPRNAATPPSIVVSAPAATFSPGGQYSATGGVGSTPVWSDYRLDEKDQARERSPKFVSFSNSSESADGHSDAELGQEERNGNWWRPLRR